MTKRTGCLEGDLPLLLAGRIGAVSIRLALAYPYGQAVFASLTGKDCTGREIATLRAEQYQEEVNRIIDYNDFAGLSSPGCFSGSLVENVQSAKVENISF